MLYSVAVWADRAYFTAQVGADVVSVSGELRYAQDTPYVSLNDVMRGLGGDLRVMPDRVQTNWREVTAVLGVNSVSVALPGMTFALLYPVRIQEEAAYMAVADVTDFFHRSYQIRVVQVEQAPPPLALTPIAPAEDSLPEEDAAALLEALELPPLPQEDEDAAGDEAAPREVAPDEPALPEEAPASDEQADVEPSQGILDGDALARVSGAVVIDPGHGGQDTGISVGAGPLEKDLTLELALRIRRILKETTAITTYMTRDTDKELSLSERVAAAEEHACDLLVSLHMGYSASYRTQGMVLFTDLALETAAATMTEEQRTRLAARHQNAEKASAAAWHMARVLQTEDALGPVVTRAAPLLLQRVCVAPCLLVEAAYLSNQDSVAALNNEETLEKMAHALAHAIAAALYHW